MLAVIQPAQDPASGLFAAFVMAAASAANGRNAVALAPSLPEHSLSAMPAEQRPSSPGLPEHVADVVAGLSRLVAGRLEQAAGSAVATGDRDACQHAARSARAICALLSGSGG